MATGDGSAGKLFHHVKDETQETDVVVLQYGFDPIDQRVTSATFFSTVTRPDAEYGVISHFVQGEKPTYIPLGEDALDTIGREIALLGKRGNSNRRALRDRGRDGRERDRDRER